LIVLSSFTIVWLLLVIYEKMRTINLKFATDKLGERSLKLSGKENFKAGKAGAMDSQLRRKRTAAERKLKPTGREKTRDVVFTKMDEMAMEVEKTASTSFEGKEKGDFESEKLGKGGDKLLKKKDDVT